MQIMLPPGGHEWRGGRLSTRLLSEGAFSTGAVGACRRGRCWRARWGGMLKITLPPGGCDWRGGLLSTRPLSAGAFSTDAVGACQCGRCWWA